MWGCLCVILLFTGTLCVGVFVCDIAVYRYAVCGGVCV